MNYRIKIMIKYAVLVVCTILFLILVDLPSVTINRIEFVLNSLITVATTLLGFIVTAVSILIGMSTNPVISEIRKNNLLGEIKWHFIETILLGLGLIVIAIVLGGMAPTPAIISEKWSKLAICAIGWFFVSFTSTCFYLVGVLVGTVDGNKNTIHEKPSAPNGELKK